jgi:hypothetical protein
MTAKLTVCITIFGSFLILTACKSDATLKSYYFPLEEQVYVYHSNGPDQTTYWLLQPEDRTKLKTHIYSTSFEEQQIIHEKYLSGGVRLEKLILYMQDSTGSYESTGADILNADIFPFVPLDSTFAYVYNVKWQHPFGDQRSFELIRNRRYFGIEPCTCLGKEKSCVKLLLNQIVSDNLDGSIELEMSGWEWYAEGIGLVKKEVNFGQDMALKLELREIISIDEFRKQKQAYE